MCDGYDIIDWKSCESYSITDDGDDYRLVRNAPFSGYNEDISTTDIVFPTLFNRHHETETSIDSIPELEQSDIHGPLQLLATTATVDQDAEESVYHKVAHWVLSQKKYFRKVELPVDDDDLEVIDPVDLFHESILDQYLLITESESERRILLRDFEAHKYHIDSVQEALQGDDYHFLRQPAKDVELELTPLITFYQLHKEARHGCKKRKRKKRRRSEGSDSSESYIEDAEEDMKFLGVPTLLENYIILNREGCAVEFDDSDFLWLSPLQEDLQIEKDADSKPDLEFVSSWFSGGVTFQDEVRTLNTALTDQAEKATVISITHSESDSESDDVWVDAPEIPHWLDDEQEELELFNQPSRPLYYYRDRIKGSYRIIGVEDEKVVLFSENDDDNIFYSEGNMEFDDFLRPNRSFDTGLFSRTGSMTRVNRVQRRVSDHDGSNKNDSGIEDVDDITSEDYAVASMSLSRSEAEGLGFRTEQLRSSSGMEESSSYSLANGRFTCHRYAVLLMYFISAFTVMVIMYSMEHPDVAEILHKAQKDIISAFNQLWQNCDLHFLGSFE